jgi:hypothetical protein
MASGDLQDIIASGSTDGKPIKIAGTSAGAATTLHTAVSGQVARDHISVWLINTDTAQRTVSVMWGGITEPDQRIGPITLGVNRGPVRVAEGWPLQNSLVVKAYADAANVVLAVVVVTRFND